MKFENGEILSGTRSEVVPGVQDFSVHLELQNRN